MPAKLAFTCGDPSGVGPEIIEAWLRQNPTTAPDVAVLGPARWLAALALHGATPVPVGDPAFLIESGRPSIAGAQVALAAMERAAAGTLSGEFTGVVTGPVSKSWLQKAGYVYPGQTEFFAARWGGEPTMAFCGGRMRVALLTWHIPLRDVPGSLNRDAFVRALAAAEELARACGPIGGAASAGEASRFEPRIGVCGLNPHAGEEGLLGREELEFIDPLLDELRRIYPGLSRTQPPDTIFARQLKGEYDVILALYHDQGLAPLKTVDFDQSLNVTLGLPFVRTSPDHGTAFGIAGKGVASSQSFANAVEIARLLARRRALKS